MRYEWSDGVHCTLRTCFIEFILKHAAYVTSTNARKLSDIL